MNNNIKFSKLYFSIFIASIAMLSDQSIAQNYVPPKTPWHLVDYWWDCLLKRNEKIETLSVTFHIAGNIADADNIYSAPVGIAEFGKIKFYGGIQTNTGGWKNKEERKITRVGRGGIFSRWSKEGKPLSLDYADGDDQTHYESAMYEGSFVSVRKKFDWSQGFYVYEVKKEEIKEDADEFTWFSASVQEIKTGKKYEIGRLKFEGKDLVIGKSIASFVEIYGQGKTTFPEMQISFQSPIINGRQCGNKTVYAAYSQNGYEKQINYVKSETIQDFVTAIISPSPLENTVKNETIYFKYN